ncbi:RNA polymerase sigma factor [Runella sp.]|uniref:RNA polymerase sigma factor n=1 Tax=Runella sp. TaxID=1960881 RepID=UPI003D0F05C7
MEERDLINRILRGESTLFAAIIKQTQGLVAQIVFKLIKNPEDRKDLAQDIYLKTYKNLSTFQFQSKLSTWIGQIAYNTCLAYLDKKKLVLPGEYDSAPENGEALLDYLSNKTLTAYDNETEQLLFRAELSELIQSVMETLPPIYKLLITLYHYEELSYDEMAAITDLPVGTVKNYLFRARKALKDRLLKHYSNEIL